MKTKFAAIAALAIAASGFAAAANASDQLAASLGVQPGQYTTAQLIQLKDTLRDGDSERVAFITNGPIDAAPSTQLAESLGVEPGNLSASDLVALKAAIDHNDLTRIAFLTGGQGMVTRNASAVSANSQLAATLGVAPGTYDSATLAAAYLQATGTGDD